MAVRQVTKRELEIAYSAPAPAANRFYLTVLPTDGAHLAFCEQPNHPETEPQLRCVVQLSLHNLAVLRDLIVGMIGPGKAQKAETPATETTTTLN